MKNILYRLCVAGACRCKDSNAVVSTLSLGLLVIGMAILLGPGAPAVRAQSTSTGAVSGQVTDQQEAAVSGTEVILLDIAKNTATTTVTNEEGRYHFVNVPPGLYDLSVSRTGFVRAKVPGQKVTIGLVLTVNVTLQLGSVAETVVVTSTSGAELQTTNATVGTTLTGRHIELLTNLGRDANALFVLQPAVAPTGEVAGAVRDQNTYQLDGGNNSDDMAGTTSTYTQAAGFIGSAATGGAPSGVMPTPAESIEEFKVAITNQTGDFNGSAGGQVQLVTKRGTNQFHGSVYEHYLGSIFQANTWSNNRTHTPLPSSHQNRFGAALGGALLPEMLGGKTYFFANYEARRYPQSTNVTRTVPTALMRAGVIQVPDSSGKFIAYNLNKNPVTVNGVTYQPATCGATNVPCDPRGIGINPLVSEIWTKYMPLPNDPTGGDQFNTQGYVSSIRLPQNSDNYVLRYNEALKADPTGSRGFVNTPDPLLLGVFTKINQLAASGGRVTDRIASLNDYNRNNLDYLAPAQNKREFFTGHLDYNITSNHHFDVVYDYQYYDSAPDNVNQQFQAYPGTVTVFGSDVLGSVHRNTFALGGALRSTLSSTIVNEAHFGLSGGGTTQFGREIVPSVFDALGGNALSFNNYLTNPQNRSTFSARNTPVWQFFDNLYWTRASHRLTFGMSYTRINSWQKSYGRQIIPLVTFNAVSNDPILNAVFNDTVFPNSTPADRTNAAQLYALLTGRVSQIQRSVSLDEDSKNYAAAPLIERNRQVEYGFYGQDSWQARPNLTLNYGLRWQIEPSPHSLNGIYSSNTIADIYGVSGVGNLFNPGTFSGSQPVYVPLDPDTPAYKTQYGQFAPSFGFAYKINGEGWGKWLGGFVGKGDQTVIRGGYSIAYVREGLNTFLLIPGSNQGPTLTANVDPANNPTIFQPGSVLYRNRANFPVRTDLSASQQQSLFSTPGSGVNAFDPNLKPGYVQSWTFGIQRELTKDTVLEVRYVGNHGTKLWRQIELNQVNISNNGFLDEFKRAQNNLAIFTAANPKCGAQGFPACNYGNSGLPVTVQLLTPDPFRIREGETKLNSLCLPFSFSPRSPEISSHASRSRPRATTA